MSVTLETNRQTEVALLELLYLYLYYMTHLKSFSVFYNVHILDLNFWVYSLTFHSIQNTMFHCLNRWEVMYLSCWEYDGTKVRDKKKKGRVLTNFQTKGHLQSRLTRYGRCVIDAMTFPAKKQRNPFKIINQR